ncbi:MAG: ferritin family protein [Planctomycetes bacterium]|nr:ferritin family protein [Planctomycetota bacterium]
MSTRLDFATLDLMDALDLAVLVEGEAYDRYVLFAEQLGHRQIGDAASVFRQMADNERKHGQDLMAQRLQRFGDAPRRVTRDDLFDVEAPEAGAIHAGMSTLRAFEVALEAESKALAFYVGALEHVHDAEIRALFAELRDEEVEHVRQVRAAIAALPPEAAIEWEQDEDDLAAL